MTKKIKFILYILMSIIALCNLNIASGTINLAVLGVGHVYTYETYDGKYKFNYNPSKGGKLNRLNLRFEQLKKEEPKYNSSKLYRTFKRKPLHFWNWYSYFFSEEYSFPYQESSGNSIHYKGLYEE